MYVFQLLFVLPESTMSEDKKNADSDEFEQLAGKRRQSLSAEFWYFLMHTKKWWLLPIIIVMVLIGVLVMAGASGLAPFIYPLF